MNTTLKMAALIKDLAAENNLPVSKVLAECKINRNFIYDLEHKGAYPSADKIALLAVYFGISADYLLGTERGQAPA